MCHPGDTQHAFILSPIIVTLNLDHFLWIHVKTKTVRLLIFRGDFSRPVNLFFSHFLLSSRGKRKFDLIIVSVIIKVKDNLVLFFDLLRERHQVIDTFL